MGPDELYTYMIDILQNLVTVTYILTLRHIFQIFYFQHINALLMMKNYSKYYLVQTKIEQKIAPPV